MIRKYFLATLLILLLTVPSVRGQKTPDQPPPANLDTKELGGQELAGKLMAIYDAIPGLEGVEVHVELGVVRLSGLVSTPEQAAAAREVASRFQGVVEVVGEPEVKAEVTERVAPLLDRMRELVKRLLRNLPLIGVAMGIVLVFLLLAKLVSNADRLFSGLSGNQMLRSVLARSAAVLVFLFGLFLSLDLLGLTGLVGALAGAAGVIGIALGFATRDLVENYLSSILLSAQSPFSVRDWVEVGQYTGSVVRMTSRDLVLMTLEGNHIRIPNAHVFKSVIVNYTRNPLRAFSFDVGLGTEENIEDARDVGLASLAAMPGVLTDPPPVMRTIALGESSVIVRFMGWVDQREIDFLKVQSEAIRILKTAFDEQGIDMPAPIHIVHLRDLTGQPLRSDKAQEREPGDQSRSAGIEAVRAEAAKADVGRETHLDDQITREQQTATGEKNLLAKKE